MSSKDRLAVPVPFQDGTKKYIKFNNNALADLEELLGAESMKELGELISSKMSFRAIRAAVFVGNQAMGGDLTLEQIGEQIDLTKLREYVKAILQAFSLATTGKKNPEVDKEIDKADPTKATDQ